MTGDVLGGVYGILNVMRVEDGMMKLEMRGIY
jgi:hypothetical protein